MTPVPIPARLADRPVRQGLAVPRCVFIGEPIKIRPVSAPRPGQTPTQEARSR